MNYKIPRHVKTYITSELYNYENNKKMLQELQDQILNETGSSSDGQPKGTQISDTTYKKVERLTSSRSILIVTDKINKIDQAYNKLSQDEKEIAQMIFMKGYTQLYAETHYYISKRVYYNVKNKMIYLTAQEYKLI